MKVAQDFPLNCIYSYFHLVYKSWMNTKGKASSDSYKTSSLFVTRPHTNQGHIINLLQNMLSSHICELAVRLVVHDIYY